MVNVFRLVFVFLIGFLSFLSMAGETSVSVPRRIVSLSPSVTETLFALGLGQKIVGVTRFCTYPEEAKQIPDVGGYLDTNYERILELQPDCVITLEEHKGAIERLKAFDIQVVSVNNKDIEGILTSIVTIGELCDVQDASHNLLMDIQGRLDKIQDHLTHRGHGRPWVSPLVLISIGRTRDSRGISRLNIAGKEGFLTAMLHLAGGKNAYIGSVPFPLITREGLLDLNPDLIIELVPDLDRKKLTKDDLRNDWLRVPGLDAVKEKNVFVFTDTYLVIPGPRFIDAVERFHALFTSFQDD